VQHGPRGERELRFYELVKELADQCGPDLTAALQALDPFANNARAAEARRSLDGVLCSACDRAQAGSSLCRIVLHYIPQRRH
jgi:hypothetical protein